MSRRPDLCWRKRERETKADVLVQGKSTPRSIWSSVSNHRSLPPLPVPSPRDVPKKLIKILPVISRGIITKISNKRKQKEKKKERSISI